MIKLATTNQSSIIFDNSCIAAIDPLIEVLKDKKARRSLIAMDIIEGCSKQGAKWFFKAICTQDFMKAMVSQLKNVIIIKY